MVISRLQAFVLVFDVNEMSDPDAFIDNALNLSYVKGTEGPLINGALAVTIDVDELEKAFPNSLLIEDVAKAEEALNGLLHSVVPELDD